MHTAEQSRSRRIIRITGRASFSSRCRPKLWPISNSLLVPSAYPAHKVLFSETQPATGIMVILEGEVRLSINSSDGRRLSLRIAKAGEVLGLIGRALGQALRDDGRHDLPGEDRAHLAAVFLQFLRGHPEVYQTVAREMSPHLQPGLRATAHGRPLNLGSRTAGAPAAGLEREPGHKTATALRAAASRLRTNRLANSSALRARPSPVRSPSSKTAIWWRSTAAPSRFRAARPWRATHADSSRCGNAWGRTRGPLGQGSKHINGSRPLTGIARWEASYNSRERPYSFANNSRLAETS